MIITKVLALTIKEFHAIWHDGRSRFLIIVPPILQLLVFSFAATMEVNNIDIAILNRDKSIISQELVNKFQGSKTFSKIYLPRTEKELAKLIETQRVKMGVNINEDFSRKLNANQTVTIQVILDGRQTNVAQNIYQYTFNIIENFNNEQAEKKGLPKSKLEFKERNWYNPNLNYMWFTVNALIGILSMLIATLLTALSIAREKETGTFDQLLVSPVTSTEILIGKTIPPLIIALIEAFFIFVAAVLLFRVPFTGSLFVLLLSTAFFLLSIVGIGLTISSLCRTQQQAILGAFMFIMPATLISGYITPIENMPICLQYLTFLNPLRFFLVIIKGIFFKGITLDLIILNLIPILIIGILTMLSANWMFNKKLD